MLFLDFFHKLYLLVLVMCGCYDLQDYDHEDYCNDMSGHPLSCYWNNSRTLKDINDENPAKDNSIFFLETSCNSHNSGGEIIVNPRLACAVESTARLHPKRSIYILYTSPGIIKKSYSESYGILKLLLKYKNVRFLHVDFAEYLQDTPLQNIHNIILRTPSLTPEYVVSDILRWITLWKYGGVYLDSDIIVLKSFDDLPENFAGAEKKPDQKINAVASGVLGFTSTGKGHEFVTRCLNHVKNNFSTSAWARNGPEVITRLAHELCNTNRVDQMFDRDCQGFKVLPYTYFYPVPYDLWSYYYTPDRYDLVLKMANDSYTVHTWNYMSRKSKLVMSRNGAYAEYARQHCPGIFSMIFTYL